MFRRHKKELENLLLQLNIISRDRKALRRKIAKIFKLNCDLIKDPQIKRKIKNGYFKDLTDEKIIRTLNDLYYSGD
jgi:hypothetical protein